MNPLSSVPRVPSFDLSFISAMPTGSMSKSRRLYACTDTSDTAAIQALRDSWRADSDGVSLPTLGDDSQGATTDLEGSGCKIGRTSSNSSDEDSCSEAKTPQTEPKPSKKRKGSTLFLRLLPANPKLNTDEVRTPRSLDTPISRSATPCQDTSAPRASGDTKDADAPMSSTAPLTGPAPQQAHTAPAPPTIKPSSSLPSAPPIVIPAPASTFTSSTSTSSKRRLQAPQTDVIDLTKDTIDLTAPSPQTTSQPNTAPKNTSNKRMRIQAPSPSTSVNATVQPQKQSNGDQTAPTTTSNPKPRARSNPRTRRPHFSPLTQTRRHKPKPVVSQQLVPAPLVPPSTSDLIAKLHKNASIQHPSGPDRHWHELDRGVVSRLHSLCGSSVCCKSGPRFAFWKDLMCQMFAVQDMAVEFVFHENTAATTSILAFDRYLDTLPEDKRRVMLGFHGIARHRNQGDGNFFETTSTRGDSLDPKAGQPNALRPAHRRNRLGDGLYIASHPSYNMRGRFFDVTREGTIALLLCLVAPGNEYDVGLGSCPDSIATPDGYSSRVGRTSHNDATTVLCTEHQDSVHVFAEVYIRGATLFPF